MQGVARLQMLLAIAVAVQRGAQEAAGAIVHRQQHRAAAVPEQDACGCTHIVLRRT